MTEEIKGQEDVGPESKASRLILISPTKRFINDAGYHLEETEKRPEFLLMRPYIKGLGLEIGTGTNRLSPTVLGIDNYNHVDADMVWDCAPEQDGKQYYQPYPFKDERFDFVFSSHVLEDFNPIVIQKIGRAHV